ncbi:ComF family protein [bacterium]|nr:MAG: ComF family protein [bacterium]
MLTALLDIFFPSVCAVCEKDIAEGPLCETCSVAFDSKKIRSPLCLKCGDPFISIEGSDRTCGKCLTAKIPFNVARSGFIYDGAVAESIHRFKYNGKVILAYPLGALMASCAEALQLKPDVVVPVPLHIERLKARGFNQSLMLAKILAKRLGVKTDCSNLKRTRPTLPQIGLKHEERAENVAGAFKVINSLAFKNKNILLIDDVLTTGATIRECAKTLKKAGAEVNILTLARAVKS